jgi:hypothetical protein
VAAAVVAVAEAIPVAVEEAAVVIHLIQADHYHLLLLHLQNQSWVA